jgi:hypothetical protein
MIFILYGFWLIQAIKRINKLYNDFFLQITFEFSPNEFNQEKLGLLILFSMTLNTIVVVVFLTSPSCIIFL